MHRSEIGESGRQREIRVSIPDSRTSAIEHASPDARSRPAIAS
jgi:hypothetical protein